MHPDRAALVFYGNEISYRGLEGMSNAFANFLLGSGHRKGDRIALFLPTFPGFAVGYLGILKMGGIVVACSPDFKERELAHQLGDSGASTILCLDELLPVVRAAGRTVPLKTVVLTGYRDFLKPSVIGDVPPEFAHERTHRDQDCLELLDILGRYALTRPEVPVGPDDIALLQYTGGTTGLPKGAIHTHFNMIYKTACRAVIAFNRFDTFSRPRGRRRLSFRPGPCRSRD